MSHSPLLELLSAAKIHNQTPNSFMVVFDLDSTLFDVSPRLQKIIENFASDTNHKALFPKATQILSKAKALPNDWGIKNAVMRAGLGSESSQFHQLLKEFWMKSFFSHEYLEHDEPTSGAIDFVNQLKTLKIPHCYLTGRDEPRMGKGSRQVLRKWGFPLSDSGEELILKPKQSLDDADFKVNELKKLLAAGYQEIWLIDNEPIIINSVIKNLPEVKIIFFDSTHSGKEEVPNELPRITNFRI